MASYVVEKVSADQVSVTITLDSGTKFGQVINGVHTLEKLEAAINSAIAQFQTIPPTPNDLGTGRIVQPSAPGPQYDWNGSAWVVNAARQAVIDALTNDTAGVRGTAPIITFLRMSPAQIDAFVDANVTGLNAPSLTAIKDILKLLGKVVSVVARVQIAG